MKRKARRTRGITASPGPQGGTTPGGTRRSQKIRTTLKLIYWPGNAPRDYKVTSLIVAYESVGFVICADGSQEEGVEKIAIYTDGDEYFHAALQLETGKWTSKMGREEDIEHDVPENLAGPCFGQVTAFLKRKRVLES